MYTVGSGVRSKLGGSGDKKCRNRSYALGFCREWYTCSVNYSLNTYLGTSWEHTERWSFNVYTIFFVSNVRFFSCSQNTGSSIHKLIHRTPSNTQVIHKCTQKCTLYHVQKNVHTLLAHFFFIVNKKSQKKLCIQYTKLSTNCW